MARKSKTNSSKKDIEQDVCTCETDFVLSENDKALLMAFTEKQFQYISYCLTKSKIFVPIGLELNSTSVVFETNKEFALKNMTFGYFNPITNSIHINIEDDFFIPEKNKKDFNIKSFLSNQNNVLNFSAKILFILFHEVNHKFFDHTKRCGQRDKTLWNIAGDYEIHNMYYVYRQVFDPTENDSGMLNSYMKIIDEFLLNGKTFCFHMDYIEKIAEEIYEMIQNSASTSTNTYSFKLDGNGDIQSEDSNGNGDGDGKNEGNENSQSAGSVTVRETEYTLPGGQKYKSVSVEFHEKPGHKAGKAGEKDAKAQAEQAAKNTALNKALSELTVGQSAKQKGNISAECMKFLKKLFHIKIDWEKILRNSLQNILEKTDYFGWNSIRTSTFLLSNMPYLPDVVEDNSKYGTLIIARDESGSMSDEDLRKAVNIIMEAKTHYKDIVLIKHDHQISSIKKFDELTPEVVEDICTRGSCGGTSHKEVFEYLRDYKESDTNGPISCFIGITDLESDVESYQDIIPSKIPTLWLVPYAKEERFPGINGKVIPIE